MLEKIGGFIISQSIGITIAALILWAMVASVKGLFASIGF